MINFIIFLQKILKIHKIKKTFTFFDNLFNYASRKLTDGTTNLVNGKKEERVNIYIYVYMVGMDHYLQT